MDYALFFKTSEQISTKYVAEIYIRLYLAHSIIFLLKYNVHFKGKAHPTIFFFTFSQNITRTVHYTKHVTARSTVHLRYQPAANCSTTTLPPTKSEYPSSCTQSTPLHTIPHLSYIAQIMTPLLFKIHVNITLLLTRVISNTVLHRICDQLIRSQSNVGYLRH